MPQGGFVVLEGSIECETCICHRYSGPPPPYTDTRLIRTPHYYGQFAVSLGKENPNIFS